MINVFLMRAFLLSVLVGCVIVAAEKDWVQSTNLYQVYPRSFKDSNGDGIGDINGITEKLPYLKEIGITAIWLSPIYQSPMLDFGYDISDYTVIQPEYGTVEDLENLIAEAHNIGIYVILDFVPNHTSDQHEWFQLSLQRDPKYDDFYIWHDGVINATTGERQPPSNWVTAFRTSAWQWNEQRQQYYLHQFLSQQPDLNYRNPAVLEAINDVLYYWLEKGIDGFRIDAVPNIYEGDIDPNTGTYPDNPVDPNGNPDPMSWFHYIRKYTDSLPESFEIIFTWRELLDNWQRDHNTETKIILTESYTTFDNMILLYGTDKRKGAQVPFNFEIQKGLTNESNADDFAYYVNHWLSHVPQGEQANWVIGNHDNWRISALFGEQRIDLINIYLQTLPGIAITYYGEEIGMKHVDISWEDTVDSQACAEGKEGYANVSRDKVRTPFQWDDTQNAGFSTANRTWLPVAPDYKENNAALQLQAETSHLKIFKRLTELRKEQAAFRVGDYEPHVVNNVLIYKRAASEGDVFITVLNIGSDDEVLNLSDLFDGVGDNVEVVVSSVQSGISAGETRAAKAFEAEAYLGYLLRLLPNEN